MEGELVFFAVLEGLHFLLVSHSIHGLLVKWLSQSYFSHWFFIGFRPSLLISSWLIKQHFPNTTQHISLKLDSADKSPPTHVPHSKGGGRKTCVSFDHLLPHYFLPFGKFLSNFITKHHIIISRRRRSRMGDNHPLLLGNLLLISCVGYVLAKTIWWWWAMCGVHGCRSKLKMPQEDEGRSPRIL